MEDVFKIAENHLKGNDLEFFKRVWSSDLSVYQRRLEAIGFSGFDHVLDAGFGVGQWLVKLAELNKNVSGIEYSPERVEAVKLILADKGIKNAQVEPGTVEKLPYKDASFDAVFCYGVIFITDYRKTLSEFRRVLKPGGKLYFSANDLGWYLYCLIEQHNKSENYNPRKMAIETMTSSLKYYAENYIKQGEQVIINREIVKNELEALGFSSIISGSEGNINLKDTANNTFYKLSDYLGSGFIFEILCTA